MRATYAWYSNWKPNVVTVKYSNEYSFGYYYFGWLNGNNLIKYTVHVTKMVVWLLNFGLPGGVALAWLDQVKCALKLIYHFWAYNTKTLYNSIAKYIDHLHSNKLIAETHDLQGKLGINKLIFP